MFDWLWLCGPSGVGKSSVAWEIHRQLGAEGAPAAFVDADQLGLCYPAPADDPDNHRLKSRNLAALWPHFRAAGARRLVLSGIVGDPRDVRRYADGLPDLAPTVCRLRADAAELRARFLRRGSLTHLLAETLADAEALEASDFADLVIDTGGLSVPEVARLVRERAADPAARPGAGPAPAPPAPSAHGGEPGDAPPPPLLWVCGPRAVGKSVVAWELLTSLTRAGAGPAYVDLAQIAMCRPALREPARALAALWPGFRAAGARRLIVSGPLRDRATLDAYRRAFPGSPVTVCRLHAGADTLTERLLMRGRGLGPPIPADDLAGRPPAELSRLAEPEGLGDAGIGDLHVATDGRTVADITAEIRQRIGA